MVVPDDVSDGLDGVEEPHEGRVRASGKERVTLHLIVWRLYIRGFLDRDRTSRYGDCTYLIVIQQAGMETVHT